MVRIEGHKLVHKSIIYLPSLSCAREQRGPIPLLGARGAVSQRLFQIIAPYEAERKNFSSQVSTPFPFRCFHTRLVWPRHRDFWLRQQLKSSLSAAAVKKVSGLLFMR